MGQLGDEVVHPRVKTHRLFIHGGSFFSSRFGLHENKTLLELVVMVTKAVPKHGLQRYAWGVGGGGARWTTVWLF